MSVPEPVQMAREGLKDVFREELRRKKLYDRRQMCLCEEFLED